MVLGRIAGLVAVALLLAGCETPGADRDAAVGDRSALGSTLGAVLASDLGRTLDDRDRGLAADAEYDALQYGQAGTAREWRNPASGHAGSVTPGPAYSVNQYTCRDYTHKVASTGKSEMVRSTACRQPDGSWRPLA